MGREIFPDGEEFPPTPAPAPALGRGFLPVPAPILNGCGEFSPLRGGAPTGSENPRPVAIPKYFTFHTFHPSLILGGNIYCLSIKISVQVNGSEHQLPKLGTNSKQVKYVPQFLKPWSKLQVPSSTILRIRTITTGSGFDSVYQYQLHTFISYLLL